MNREVRPVFFLRRFGQASLVVLAAALPFELVRPVAPIGPLQLSSVEIFLYATLALWAVERGLRLLRGGLDDAARRARLGWRALPEAHRAVAAWAAVLLVSGVLAPMTRAAALKFGLRSLGGVALFLAAADLLDSRRAVWRTLSGITAGAALAALLMALEIGVGGFAARLRPFHGQSFGVLGLARASGPFQYPNIAAMYLEAALPALLAASAAAGAMADARRCARAVAAALGLGLLLAYALVLTASRAGIATAFLILLGVAAAARGLPLLRRLSLALAAGTIVVAILAQAFSPRLALRLRFWKAKPWYGSALSLAPGGEALPAQLPPGSETTVRLSVRNTGGLPWSAIGERAIHLSYHWMRPDGSIEILDGVRTQLPHDVAPDQSVDLVATLRTPPRAGRFVLWWDLVHEQVAWFSDAGDPGQRQVIAVGLTPVARKSPLMGHSLLHANTYDQFSRLVLWRAGLLAFVDHPLLGLGPDNFRRGYGRYAGRAVTDERLHANNLYIEVLATLGLAGAVAFGGLIVALARTARRAAALEANRVLVLGVAGALAAYLLHGLLDYFFEFTPTYGLWWLLGGALVALERLAARAQADRALIAETGVGAQEALAT